MLRILLWEQRLLQFAEDARIPGTYHPGRGHEAVAVGAMSALRQDDYIMYDHRGCGQVIAKGLPLVQAYGDLLGNMAGTTRGLGSGIIHIAAPELGILGQSGTLGGCFPIAAGAALSAKYRGTDQVCVCFFGEGTGNRGQFHEAANAAGVWKLPVIWICENNGWAISTSVRESTAVEDLSLRAQGYGIPGVSLDGTDVEAVFEAVNDAVVRARSGSGGAFIEAKVPRISPHHLGDSQSYRSEDIESLKKDDPVAKLAATLLKDGVVTEEALESLRKTLEAEVDAAAEEAAAAPLPPADRVYWDVYV
jgi:pyruvate dehydrogenase E1 component alpha subunit